MAGNDEVGGGSGRSRRRLVPVAMAVATLVALGAGGLVLATGDDDGPDQDGATPSTEGAAAGSDRPTLLQSFPRASRRLERAGTFTYRGTVRAESTSAFRPTRQPAATVTVQGEVSLPDGAHEVATTEDGTVTETLLSGAAVWTRTAHSRAALTRRPLERRTDLDLDRLGWRSAGGAVLPRLLGSTSDRRAAEPDAEGRRRFRATVPAEALGTDDAGRPLGPAVIVLTLDGSGDPARVELGPIGLVPDPPLRLAWDISRIGEPVSIDPPGVGPVSATGTVTPEDVVAAGVAHPVELGAVPQGWVLLGTYIGLSSPRAGCNTLSLLYQEGDDPEALDARGLSLDVSSPDCAAEHEPYPDRITAGAFTGTADEFEGSTWAEVSDGRTVIEIFGQLSKADLTRLLETLEPFDPQTLPEPMDGVPSS